MQKLFSEDKWLEAGNLVSSEVDWLRRTFHLSHTSSTVCSTAFPSLWCGLLYSSLCERILTPSTVQCNLSPLSKTNGSCQTHEINMNQCWSDDSWRRRADGCSSPYDHKPAYTYLHTPLHGEMSGWVWSSAPRLWHVHFNVSFGTSWRDLQAMNRAFIHIHGYPLICSTWPTPCRPPNPIKSAWHMVWVLHPQSTSSPASSAFTCYYSFIQMAPLQL